MSAIYRFRHNGLDVGRADVTSFRLLGSVRYSASAEFHLEHLLSMHLSISLDVDPSREQEFAQQRFYHC